MKGSTIVTKEAVTSTDSVAGTHMVGTYTGADSKGINGATGPITEVTEITTLGDVSIAISQPGI